MRRNTITPAKHPHTLLHTMLLAALCLCPPSTQADTFVYDLPTLLGNQKLDKLTLPVTQTKANGNEIQLSLTLRDALSGTVILQNPDGLAVKSTQSGTLTHTFTSIGSIGDGGPHETTQTLRFQLPPNLKIDGDWQLSIKPQTAQRKKPALLMQWSLEFPEQQDNNAAPAAVNNIAQKTALKHGGIAMTDRLSAGRASR